MATGLQRFDWNRVAISAVSAGVADKVGRSLGLAEYYTLTARNVAKAVTAGRRKLPDQRYNFRLYVVVSAPSTRSRSHPSSGSPNSGAG